MSFARLERSRWVEGVHAGAGTHCRRVAATNGATAP